MTRIAALVLKDARLHGRSIGVTVAGVILLFVFAGWLRPDGRTGDRASLIFNVNFLLVILWGDWFVSREKTKATVAWLRSLPLSDGELVASKMVAHALCGSALWTACAVLFPHEFSLPEAWATWCVLLLALLAFGAVSLACRWRFSQKLGQMLPMLIVFAALLVFILVRRSRPDFAEDALALWSSTGGKGVAAALLTGVYVAAWWTTVRWVRSSDTSRLVE